MRFILLVLACVPTAFGQDFSVRPLEFGTVRHFGPPALSGRFEPGFESPSLITDVSNYPEHRLWAIYDLSELDQEVSRGTLRFSVGIAGVYGREFMAEHFFVQFRDMFPYMPQPFMPNWTDEELEEIWTDIGTGSLYGGLDISYRSLPEWDIELKVVETDSGFHQFFDGRTSGRADRYVEFPLSASAIHDINTARGGDWAVGASIAEVALEPLLITYPSGRTSYPSEYFYLATGSLSGWYINLEYGSPPPLGDFTGDGVTDQSDLDFVLLNWGIPSDQAELDAVLLTWGQGTALGAAGVPEPNTVWLAAVAVIMAAVLFRRRRWT